MASVKQSTGAVLPVRLVSSVDGFTPVTGMTGSDVTVTYCKADSTTSNFPGTATFTELTTAAFAGSGTYLLTVPSSATNILGVLTVATTCAGARVFVSQHLEVVANIESDTYGRIGAPAGASVSADVAAVKSELDTVNTSVGSSLGTNVTNVYSRIGAPAGASISADIAAVQSTAASAASSASTASSTSSTINTKIGSPIHGSVSLDIANIAASIDLTPVLDAVAAVQDTVDTIASIETGKWVIYSSGGDANRQVFYDSDDNVIIKFNLFEEDGTTPTSTNPFYRVPVP